jgi:hypothetical protein
MYQSLVYNLFSRVQAVGLIYQLLEVCKLQVKQLNHVIPIHNLHKPNCTPKNPLNMWVTGAWALSRCQSHFGTASCQLVGLATQ